jgi:CxxC-x17-CxxC domain-containing protein
VFYELWPISGFFPVSGKPVMEFSDRVLKCMDCGAEFVFTAGEQLFFHDKQFKNDPKHCKQCKAKRVRGGSRVRPETRTTCSQCGEPTTVPFKPTQGRPVLCRVCFKQQKAIVPPVQEEIALPAQDSNLPTELEIGAEPVPEAIPEPS